MIVMVVVVLAVYMYFLYELQIVEGKSTTTRAMRLTAPNVRLQLPGEIFWTAMGGSWSATKSAII